MSRDNEELVALAAAYVLGALDEDERRRVEAALDAGDADLTAAVAEHGRELEMLADSVLPIDPAETSRRRVMKRIDAGATATPPERPPASVRWLTVAATVVVAAMLILALQLRKENDRLVADCSRLLARVDRLTLDLTDSRGELEKLQLAHSIVAAPGAFRTVLASTAEEAPAGQAFVDPARGLGVFLAARLPELDADRTYQLWLIRDGAPVSAGTFETDAGGATLHLVTDLVDVEIEAWAVSVEPAGGVPQPTGPIVLQG